MKYVLVTGGVISGIGKGTLASSTGLLLKKIGLRVTAIKIDPYMNIDAGTMAPTEHGEVFVLDDGGEADLDLGNYERYLDITLSRENNLTTGKIYQHVIEREVRASSGARWVTLKGRVKRRGDYLGKTVQVIPHVTDAVQDWLERVARIPVDESAEEADVCIIELGGTVGDIESMPFVEALRQFQFRVGRENFALVHVSMVPLVNGEQKTKPTQASIRDLRGLGLTPDLIACRCEEPIDQATSRKISMFCHVGPEQVLGVHNVQSIYHVPLLLQSQGLVTFLRGRLQLDAIEVDNSKQRRGIELAQRWKDLTVAHDRLFDVVHITLVGKYTSLKDSYMSVIKTLEHASMRCGRKLILDWVDSSDLEEATQVLRPREFHAAWQALCSASGVLVPGGFGVRGTEGMLLACKWAREKKVPFLGICLGFQVAVIEWVRNVLGVSDANSAELDQQCTNPVIVFMPEISRTHLGGTMRLGLRPTIFQPGTEWSLVRQLYGNQETIWERHRHRYEVNPEWVKKIEKSGLIFTGRDERGERMQVAEYKDHPFYCGLQAHPEFCSRPLNPSPPFLGFVAAAAGVLDEQLGHQKNYLLPHPSKHLRYPSPVPSPRPEQQTSFATQQVLTNGVP